MSFLHKGAELKTHPKSSRQSLFIIGGICIVVALGIYWYFSRTPSQDSQESSQTKQKELPLKQVNWQKTLYEDPTFQSLKNPLKAPLEVGTSGNPDPFQVKIK